MTSKEGPELSYLNLCIIQSPHGISIYQTKHIKDTILVQWFPDATECVNSDTTPFKVDSTFEIYLAETLPDTSAEIHHLKECSLGKFSAHIGKILHIMQYNQLDLMYAANHLSGYTSTPSAP